jgi:hypothetical protein
MPVVCQGRVFFNLLVLFLRYRLGRYVIMGMCYVYTCEIAGCNMDLAPFPSRAVTFRVGFLRHKAPR